MQVNGVELSFINSDNNTASRLTLFPSTAGKHISTNYQFNTTFSLFLSLMSLMSNSTQELLVPGDFFMFLETGFGGSGWIVQSDGGPSCLLMKGAAIGIR